MLNEGEYSLVPSSGFVVKTALEVPMTDPPASAGTKVFLNICYNKRVPEAPGGFEKIEEAIMRDDWAIPVIVSSAREDTDKAGSKCLVYDCCANTKILQYALRDSNVRLVLIESCLEVAEHHAGTVFSRDYKIPKLKWKGPTGVPIVYRDEAAIYKSVVNDDGATTKPTIASTLDDLAKNITNDDHPQNANGGVKEPSSQTMAESNNSLLFVEHEAAPDANGISLLPNMANKYSKKLVIEEIDSTPSADSTATPPEKKAKPSNVNIRELKRTLFPMYQVSVTSEDTKALSSATLELEDSARLLVIKLQGSTSKNVEVMIPPKANLEKMQVFFAMDTSILSIFL